MEFPRVLIVYISCLNQADQHGLSLRKWFASWPKESLAQIYSGADNEGEKYCGRTFKLGPEERHWGDLFLKLKDSSLGHSSQLITVEDKKIKTVDKKTLFLNKIGSSLLNSGLWELVFYPKLSDELKEWIEDFSPQLVYCQGYDLTFCWLPMMIAEKFQLPVVFQTTDDWPNYLYKNSLLVHPIVIRTAGELIKKASLRFAISDRMAVDYRKQFGVPFEIVMNCDNVERFTSVAPQRIANHETISVVYSGGLGFGRWESLLDLCLAAEELGKEGLRFMISAFTTSIPIEATNSLLDRKNLRILPPLLHDQLPAYFRGADILFLPETFNLTQAKEIRYSISQKAQLYMMSGKPILVYGSLATGVVDYAKREGWALVVSERNISHLVEAMRLLVANKEVVQNLVQKSLQVAEKNHNEDKIRKQILIRINEILRST